MDPVRGAGQRVKAEFTAGHMHFVAENRAFRNENQQEYFVTTHNRIIRYDAAHNQHNAYDARLKEFVPCDLLPGEDAVEFGEQRELFERLIGQQGWGDFFVDRAGRIAVGAGKQAIFGAAAGVAASLAAPIVTKGVGAAIDAFRHPVQTVAHVKTSVATSALQAKTSAAQHMHAHAIVPPIHKPLPIPFDPPPWIPPCGGPRPPWWLGGLWNAGSTTTGAGIGFAIAGPPGAFVGSIIGAGVGAAV